MTAFENNFKENIRNLKDCHTILSEYAADDDEISALLVDLKSIGNLYKEELVEYHKYQTAIGATEEHFNQDDNIGDNFQDVFKDIFKNTKSVRCPADSIVDRLLGFTKTNPDPDENGNDESLICTQSAINSIDPITKKLIITPFKNKICSHVYEKQSILEYIKMKKKLAKCPYVGCSNSDMRLESMELDFSSQRINLGAFTSTQLQRSVTTLGSSSDEEDVADQDEEDDEEEMDVDDY